MFGFLKKKKKKPGDAEGETEPEVEAAKPDAEGAEGAEGEAPAKKKLSGKKLILFIVLPAVLVLGGGGAAAFMLLSGGKTEQHAEAEAGGHEKAKGGHGGAEAEAEPIAGPNGTTISYGEGVIFVAMPEMLVNITGADGRPAFLKLRLTLEASDDAVVTALTDHVPRDIAGSAGAYRLRLELLRRVNIAIAPSQISAVLIEEMLVQ
jgi:flagellar protein FliL